MLSTRHLMVRLLAKDRFQKTILAASGSIAILNSDKIPKFPLLSAPPIKTNSSILSFDFRMRFKKKCNISQWSDCDNRHLLCRSFHQCAMHGSNSSTLPINNCDFGVGNCTLPFLLHIHEHAGIFYFTKQRSSCALGHRW